MRAAVSPRLMPEVDAKAAAELIERLPAKIVVAPSKEFDPPKVKVPEPVFVRLPPELVKFEAKITLLPLVSIPYCWAAAVLNRAERSVVMPEPY